MKGREKPSERALPILPRMPHAPSPDSHSCLARRKPEPAIWLSRAVGMACEAIHTNLVVSALRPRVP